MINYKVMCFIKAENEGDLARKLSSICAEVISFHDDSINKWGKLAHFIMAYPERANSWIAEDCGASMQTVMRVREGLERDGKIPYIEVFKRRDEKTTPRQYRTLVGSTPNQDS